MKWTLTVCYIFYLIIHSRLCQAAVQLETSVAKRAEPLYKPIVGRGNQDDTKRSTDRFESDFIWNTNWAERVRFPG